MGDPVDVTATLNHVENCLLGVFNYYAQISNERSADGRKPVRVMTSSKFQRFAVDANLIDDPAKAPRDPKPGDAPVVTHALVDLIYKQAAGRKTGKEGKLVLERGGRMNFDQFMDATVLVALSKFPKESEGPMREFTALTKLYETYLQSFNGDVNDPLEDILLSLDDEWYTLMQQVAPVLYDLYLRYFKIEVNPHFHQAGSTAHAQALKSFMELMDDFSVARQVADIRPLIYTAVRDAEHTAIPKELQDRLNVSGHGKFFTFHHFLLALQKIADAQQRDGGSAEKIARLLHVMEQARAPHGRVRFLPTGYVSDETTPVESRPVEDMAEVRGHLRAVFNWYVSLGEPLKRELSTRKFTRFLRDAGLLSPESGSHGMSTTSKFGLSSMTPSRNRSGFSFSPTKAQVRAATEGTPLTPEEENALPLRVIDPPPLLQVDVDLIFIKARHPKYSYSVSALPGYDYRDRGEHGPGYYREMSGTSTNSRKQTSGGSHGGGSHLDYPAFEVAIEEVARRVYPKDMTLSESLEKFAKDICQALMILLADPDALLALVPVSDPSDPRVELRQVPIALTEETYKLIEDTRQPPPGQPPSKVRDGLHNIFKGYLQQKHRQIMLNGHKEDLMVIEDFNDFCTEFRIIDRIKPLILNRIFYKNAHFNIAATQSVAAMNEDGFIRSLVFIAEKMEQTAVLKSQEERVLALLHHVNQLCFCSRLAHLRPVFILEQMPTIVATERQPQGWRNMLKTLATDSDIAKELSASQYGSTSQYGQSSKQKASNSIR